MSRRDIIQIFMDSGLKRTEARTLKFLFENDSGFSRDIERRMDLRQPEVSNAMMLFKSKKWIDKKEITHEGKGRPNILYKLRKTKKKIIEELLANCENEINRLQKLSEELEALNE
jgi:predicted transcriptional regulator